MILLLNWIFLIKKKIKPVYLVARILVQLLATPREVWVY